MNPSELKQLPSKKVLPALSVLSYREREILRLISGLGDGYTYTREEVAHVFKVGPDRIDTIVQKAMRKVERQLETISEGEIMPAGAGLNIAAAVPEYCCEDEVVADMIVELYVALNGMHRGAGGTGLTIDNEQSCSGVLTLDGAPIQ